MRAGGCEEDLRSKHTDAPPVIGPIVIGTGDTSSFSNLIVGTGSGPTVSVRPANPPVKRIIVSSAYVVALGKKAFYRQIRLAQPEAYAFASEVMCTNAAAEDAQEGMTAFLEKRRPSWRGR